MSKKLKLTDREWRAFSISSLFDIFTGANIPQKNLSIGIVPRISATDNNNGIDSFYTPIQSNSYRTNKECVSVSFLGSVFYQPYEASYDMKIHSLRLKGNKAISEHYGLFVATELRKQCSKFSYGNQVSSTDLPKQKLLLPIQADGTPDWKFMETYMRQVEDELLSEVRPKLEAQLLEHIISLGALEDREWKEFQFKDVFYIVDGYYNKKPPMEENGTLPFLGATQYNNGVTGMTSKDNVRLRDKVGGNSMNDVEKRFYAGGCIAITNNGSVGHAYYQSGEFTCSHDITVIYLKDQAMSKELATFLIPSIQKAGESFAYAKKWRPIRMRRSKLILPIQADGTPDWEFMSAFMKKVEQDTLSGALHYFKPKKCKQMLTGG